MKSLTSIQDVYTEDAIEFEKIAQRENWSYAEFFRLLLRAYKSQEQSNIAEIQEKDEELLG